MHAGFTGIAVGGCRDSTHVKTGPFFHGYSSDITSSLIDFTGDQGSVHMSRVQHNRATARSATWANEFRVRDARCCLLLRKSTGPGRAGVRRGKQVQQ